MLFLEPSDWIGVALIVMGLALVIAAVVVHMRKTSRSTVSDKLHPDLARDLESDEPSTATTVTSADEPAGLEQARTGADQTDGEQAIGEQAVKQEPRAP